MPFTSDITCSSTFSHSKSSVRFSNSADMINDGLNASSKATFYAINSVYNVAQISIQMGIGAICALELAKNGVYVNSAVSSNSTFKPFIKNFLVFTADYPLVTMGIGAAAMIVLNPDPTFSACKNIVSTAYNIGEMTVDFTFATKEGLLGVMLLAKEKTCELNKFLMNKSIQGSLSQVFTYELDDFEDVISEWILIENRSSLISEDIQNSSIVDSREYEVYRSTSNTLEVVGDAAEGWTII